MNGKSLNLTDEKLGKLKKIIPEAFTENKIDWKKLKVALGDDNFIYPDKFYETKEEYLSIIGYKDETGHLTCKGLFNKNDQLKTNTVLQMKDAEIEFKVV